MQGRILPRASGERVAVPTPRFRDFWAPDWGDDKFLWFNVTQLCCFVTADGRLGSGPAQRCAVVSVGGKTGERPPGTRCLLQLRLPCGQEPEERD